MLKEIDKELIKQLREVASNLNLIDNYGIIGTVRILDAVRRYWLEPCNGVGDELYQIIGIELEDKTMIQLLEEEPFLLDVNLSEPVTFALGSILDGCIENGDASVEVLTTYTTGIPGVAGSFSIYYDAEGCGLLYWYC